MEITMTIIVREKRLMRANFFFQEMLTFHNMRIGIMITAVLLVDPSEPIVGKLTGRIGDHVDYARIDYRNPLIFQFRWGCAFRYSRSVPLLQCMDKPYRIPALKILGST